MSTDRSERQDGISVLLQTPGGASAQRKLVLDWAIRGRLSDSAPSDESTSLLPRAEADRVSRQQRGLARQMKELGPVGDDEAPFLLPRSWSWTRVGLAMNLVNGRAFKPSDWSTVGLPIVRIQNLNDRSAPFNHCAFEVDPKHRLRSGDFLISWSGTPGTSFGAFIWTGPDGVLNQHIFRAELYGGCYEPEFLRVVINARLDEMIARAHGAVGLQHITKGELEHLPIPLPPLPEQKRIVAKVDELMKLIDDLEARQTKATATQSRFRTSALDALTKADGPAQLAVAWKRVAGNFEVLFEQAESVAGLRRVVRDLAVVGRVVEQRTGEGDGRELLPQLHRDVEAAGGKWSDPRSDEIAAETGAWIPPSWAWVRLATVATFGPRNGYSPKAVDYPTAVKTLTLTASSFVM